MTTYRSLDRTPRTRRLEKFEFFPLISSYELSAQLTYKDRENILTVVHWFVVETQGLNFTFNADD